MESSIDIDNIDWKIIKDKTLSRHDALYKLILIGDTCKFSQPKYACYSAWSAC